MKYKKPKTIILLIIIFILAIWRDIGTLARYSITVDYQVLVTIGIGFFVPILAGTLLVLHTVTVWYLFKPKRKGLGFGLASVALNAIASSVIWGITVFNKDSVKTAYQISRTRGGLPLREEQMQYIFSPVGLGVTLSLIIGSALIIGYLFWRNKQYFNPRPKQSATDKHGFIKL